MWELRTTDTFEDTLVRSDVADVELDDMKIFLRRHLRGVACQYRVRHETPNRIVVTVAATGNDVLYLSRVLL